MSVFDEQPRLGDMLLGPDQVADGPHPYAWVTHYAHWLPIAIPEAIVFIFLARSLYGVWKIKAAERAYLRQMRDKNSN